MLEQGLERDALPSSFSHETLPAAARELELNLSRGPAPAGHERRGADRARRRAELRLEVRDRAADQPLDRLTIVACLRPQAVPSELVEPEDHTMQPASVLLSRVHPRSAGVRTRALASQDHFPTPPLPRPRRRLETSKPTSAWTGSGRDSMDPGRRTS